jgi:bis(5'-nucleosyl)-tetraphosphatase (symmetrical)
VLQPIFVGDVQGCADELETLLGRVEATFGTAFELWIVGDVVNRGPDNLRALRRVRELVAAGRGHYVLGNHELNLLRIAAGLCEPSPLDTISDLLEAPDADDWIEWLRRRPVAIAGALGSQRFALVHAAVHPDWGIDEIACRASRVTERLGAESWCEAREFLAGDPAEDEVLDALLRFTRCRSANGEGSWAAEAPALAPSGYRAWHEEWSERGHGYGVVYGHWALQGLHVARGLRGLDTGCVHHGRGRDGVLTAWVPDPNGEEPFAPHDEAFWRVQARRAYYVHRDSFESGEISD